MNASNLKVKEDTEQMTVAPIRRVKVSDTSASFKTVKTRSDVLRVVYRSNHPLSTHDIAVLSKKSKANVASALRWAESEGLVSRTGSVRTGAAGRPMVIWSV